jgi:hypothetical protein
MLSEELVFLARSLCTQRSVLGLGSVRPPAAYQVSRLYKHECSEFLAEGLTTHPLNATATESIIARTHKSAVLFQRSQTSAAPPDTRTVNVKTSMQYWQNGTHRRYPKYDQPLFYALFQQFTELLNLRPLIFGLTLFTARFLLG